MHQRIANATFQVISGNSSGSGFSFFHESLVVTNFHVVSNKIDMSTRSSLGDVLLRSENNEEYYAEIIMADSLSDFAILRLRNKLSTGREVLQPSKSFTRNRGAKLIFAGFPHGIPHLLTSEAVLSAPFENDHFYLDGMVNGGNSGGPIVNIDDGKVVGIVTQRRYLGAENADVIAHNAKELASDLRSFTGVVRMGGIDLAGLNKMYAESLGAIVEMMKLNANSGIGIGFPITPVTAIVEEKLSDYIR